MADLKKRIKIEYKPVEDLIMYANNPRKNDGAALDAVVASIKEFGFKNPVVVDRDNVIVCGHTRVKAAKKLKIEEVPTICADDLTPAQIKAYRLADNKVSEIAEWDMELLELELDDINLDMEVFGFDYTGINLRQEQVDANIENAKELGYKPTWICDDSLNADKYIKDESVDMIMSCPPYADLEQYSDDPRDIRTMEYDDFLRVYTEIIKISIKKLKPNRFAVWVVGDVRDKKGFYRDFLSDTKKAFINAGVPLYNEFVLVEQIATAAVRVRKQFNAARKNAKCHQNVLVFFKGDPKTIKDNYHEVNTSRPARNGRGARRRER